MSFQVTDISGVKIIYFTDSNLKKFYIDYASVQNHLEDWINDNTKPQYDRSSIALITGLTKVGKSTVLNKILPLLIKQKISQTQVYFLSIDFTEYGNSLVSMTKKFFETLNDFYFDIQKKNSKNYPILV